MKYVPKLEAPDFFIEHIKDLNDWDDYHNLDDGESKRQLREYIISHEQFGICIYCECNVCVDTSHIEHVKPKSKYIGDTFNYDNITVSCEGKTHNPPTDKTKYNCGHEKNDIYDDQKFLNPSVTVDIRDYLNYDLDSFEIICSGKDPSRYEHSINTLKLNSEYLKHGRKLRLKSFKKHLKTIRDIDERKNKALEIAKKDKGAFISLIKFYTSKMTV
ncbi:retron system putative HNH endonuclease [Aliivibrio logei]|uniref:retron system putative HNH endonuclease n=1 Tax=Aliivibrio logei TaxID=688 RepID=UPI0003A263A0|nr:retron system putative HNH endonuclease [Aliivibrio logei]